MQALEQPPYGKQYLLQSQSFHRSQGAPDSRWVAGVRVLLIVSLQSDPELAESKDSRQFPQEPNGQVYLQGENLQLVPFTPTFVKQQ